MTPLLAFLFWAQVWVAPPGIQLTPEEGGFKVTSPSEGEFTIDSIQAYPVSGASAFAVDVRIRVDLRVRALPEIACFGADGVEIPFRTSLTAPATSTTRWQQYRRVFPPCPGAAHIRARIRAAGHGDLWLQDLQVRPVEIDPYQTGALISQVYPRDRKGLVLESNLGIVNSGLLSAEDRDGDGKWAVIRIDLDRISTPEQQGEDWRTGFGYRPNELYWSDGAVLKSDSVREDRPPDFTRALHLRMRAHPGPYRAYLNDPGRAVAVSVDGRSWRRFAGGSEADLGVLPLTEGIAELWVDACYRDPVSQGPVYFDYLRLMPVDKAASAERLFEAARQRSAVPGGGTINERRVPLTFAAPLYAHGAAWPVRGSVPVRRGELRAAGQAAVLDRSGRPVPSQNRALATWPDGSVKWLCLDFTHDFSKSGDGNYTLVYGAAVRAGTPPAQRVAVMEGPAGLAVDTGAIRFLVPRAKFGIIEDVRLASGRVVQREPVSAEIAEANGTIWRALDLPVHELKVERAGPLHTVILASTRMPAPGQKASGFTHRARIHAYAGSPLVQIDYFVANTDSRPNVVARSITLRVRPVFQAGRAGSVVQADGAGAKQGWAFSGGIAAGLEAFAEQYPKAWRWGPGKLEIALWAPEGGDYEWFQGVGKTHRLSLLFGATGAPADLLAHGPVLALAAPEWYCASGALGPLSPAATGVLPAVERTLAAHMETAILGKMGLGFENFGDHSSAGYVKGSYLWDNNEYDVPAAGMVHFARTGNRNVLRAALASALHYLDVDTIHYSWQHADWTGAPRTHSHSDFGHHTAEPPGMSHAGYVQGLIWYSYFTGDQAGLSGARGIADWVLAAMRPERSVGMMERASGHPLMTLTDVYEATGEEQYLAGAARLVDWVLKWEDPVRGGFQAPITEKPAFLAGSPFCSGLLWAGLAKFNSWARAPEIEALLERTARQVLTDMWRPPANLMFKGVSEGNGSPVNIASQLRLMAAMYARTSDAMFLAVPREMLVAGFGGPNVQFGTRTTGLVYNFVPSFLAALAEYGDPVPEPSLSVEPASRALAIPPGGRERACFRLTNSGTEEITGLQSSFQPRLDFRVPSRTAVPERLLPGQSFDACYELVGPERINLTYVSNREAYAHWSASYRRAGKARLAHAYLKINLQEPQR